MQKVSMICLFTASSFLCTLSVASLHSMVSTPWPKKLTRSVASPLDTQEDIAVEKNYKIASDFKRSKAIWGVYDKLADHIEDESSPGKKLNTLKTKLGELILKDGQIVLVSPLSFEGVTQVEMAHLPYKKEGKHKLHVNIEGLTKEELTALGRLYAPIMEGIEGYEEAKIKQMSCTKKRSRLSCELAVSI
ncbi:MAG: hypothetical protein CME71_07970 [Halobacteriovorax sp.]|nr:hypothetical protein [Halobacteriovorax sp.]